MAFARKRLRVETPRHVIEGIVQLPTEGYRSRTTDYLNAHDSDFVALTEASILPVGGGAGSEHEFVAVNLRHAVLVIELETLGITDVPVGPVVTTLTPVEALPDPEPDPEPEPEPADEPPPGPPPASAPPPGAA